MKMKKTFALLLAACMSLSLVACGGNTEKKEISNNESVVSETQNGAKDSVVIAIGTEPETLDPTQGWGHGNSPIVQSTLVKYTADLTFEKDLATDYKLSEDGLTWTFKVRDDAYFTDGEKLTAEDVAGKVPVM